MARWAPERGAVMDALAEEFLHNWRHGRRVLAVDTGGVDAARYVDDLAAALGRAGQPASVAMLDDDAELAAVRSDVIAPFRAATGDEDATLVLGLAPTGPDGVRRLVDFVAYVESDDRVPGDSPSASALINARDREHPRRVFADSC